VPRIAPALQELVGGRTTEVLPALKNISLKGFQSVGPLHKGIDKFVAARRLAGLPVTVSYWEGEGERERERELTWQERWERKGQRERERQCEVARERRAKYGRA
jgi:hypothetical protein